MDILMVLHQNPDGYPAGIEQYIFDLILGLNEKGIGIFLFFPEKNNLTLRYYKDLVLSWEKKYKGGYISPTQLHDWHTESTFHRVLIENNVEIVHFQSLRNLPLSLIEVAKDAGKEVVLSIHDYFLFCIHFILLNPNFCGFERDIEKCFECLRKQRYDIKSSSFIEDRKKYVEYLFSKVDIIHAPSRFVRDIFIELFSGLKFEKFRIIGNGVNKRVYGSEEMRKTKIPINLAFLGNFLRHKGSHIFNELVRHFQEVSDIKFYIIGNVYDPILFKPSNLHVIGGYKRESLSEILSSYNIDMTLLLSTVPETFSYTLSESVLSRVPVIAIDLGALGERVAELGVGFLIPREEPLPFLIQTVNELKKTPNIIDFFKERCYEVGSIIPGVEEMVENYSSQIYNIKNSEDRTH
jgi:hypothetical protein